MASFVPEPGSLDNTELAWESVERPEVFLPWERSASLLQTIWREDEG